MHGYSTTYANESCERTRSEDCLPCRRPLFSICEARAGLSFCKEWGCKTGALKGQRFYFPSQNFHQWQEIIYFWTKPIGRGFPPAPFVFFTCQCSPGLPRNSLRPTAIWKTLCDRVLIFCCFNPWRIAQMVLLEFQSLSFRALANVAMFQSNVWSIK